MSAPANGKRNPYADNNNGLSTKSSSFRKNSDFNANDDYNDHTYNSNGIVQKLRNKTKYDKNEKNINVDNDYNSYLNTTNNDCNKVKNKSFSGSNVLENEENIQKKNNFDIDKLVSNFEVWICISCMHVSMDLYIYTHTYASITIYVNVHLHKNDFNIDELASNFEV